MEYLWLLIGILLGSALSQILRFEFTTFGVLKIDHKHHLCCVQLDHKHHLCCVQLEEEDCTKITKKKVVLEVDHNANLSQD